MNLDKEIKGLKDENEKCYEQCEGCCSSVKENVCSCRDAIILSALEQYRAIGTVEECRESRERQRAKKPIKIAPCKSVNYFKCSSCGEFLSIGKPFCKECGNAVDWSGEID